MFSFTTLLTLAVSICALPLENSAVLDLNKIGVPADKRSDPQPLALDFTVQYHGNLTVDANSKRSVPLPIRNFQNVEYLLDVYLGSNKQHAQVALDTGSSDLWVYKQNTNTYGAYDPLTSSSSKDTGDAFLIKYLDQSSASGEYYLDALAIGSTTTLLKSFQFASIPGGGDPKQTSSAGIFGVADKDQEAEGDSGLTYNNLPWALQAAGIIPKASYSLYVGTTSVNQGTIIFGGIDQDKIDGGLSKYSKADVGLSLNVVDINFNGQDYSEGSPYVLDSGTSWGLLTTDAQQVLDSQFNVLDYLTQNGIQYRIIECQDISGSVTFNFGNNKISIPYSELQADNGDGTCTLTFSPNEDYGILGDVFLRHAYVYYDLTDHTISIGKSKASSSSNIVAA